MTAVLNKVPQFGNSAFILDIETQGLEPMTDKISCICVKNYKTKEAVCFTGKDEKLILESFWNFVCKDNHYVELIGFNISLFDIVFIIKRCIINEVPVRQFSSTDLRQLVNAFFYSYDRKSHGTLGDWAGVLGMEKKTSLGSEMPELYRLEKFDEIKAHCMEDIEITEKLTDRLVKVGMLRFE